MHMRRKPWARPELAACGYYREEPTQLRGRWGDEFARRQPLQVELGCGKGVSTACMALENPGVNFVAVDVGRDVLGCARRNAQAAYGDAPVDNLILAALICGALILWDRPVIQIFNRDAGLVAAASQALPVFSLSFLPMALNLVVTAYLYSTKRTVQADAIAVCRGIAVKAAAIFAIPPLLGGDAIWAAPLAAEVLTLLLALLLNRTAPLAFR